MLFLVSSFDSGYAKMTLEAHSSQRPRLSIVIPMYNEQENAAALVEEVGRVITPLGLPWELVLVNDGSTDGTLEVIEQLSRRHPHLRIVSYAPNRGRGAALRRGFRASRGDWIISTDADLSYSPSYMLQMIEILRSEPETDVVLASPYMQGGRVEEVPFFRHIVSRLGNRFLKGTLPKRIHTVTCVFRAYRREVLDDMELESDGKEIHLEILSKAMAVGRSVREIPATLRNRKKGRSKSKFAKTSLTHVVFSFMEKPMMFFGLVGLLLFLAGMAIGVYLFWLYFRQELNPVRPLMNLMALLTISGLFMVSFGFLAIKIALIRKEIYKIQKENLEIKRYLQASVGPIAGSGDSE